MQTIDERLVEILNDKALITGTLLDGKGETMVDSDSITDALLDWAENG